jgi:hypothetical protein
MTNPRRLWRPGGFSREILDLFVRLEAVPKRERGTDEYRIDRKRLGTMLDLGPLALWLSVNEDEPEPLHESRGGLDYEDWKLVHDKRQQLLAAAVRAALLEPAATGRYGQPSSIETRRL